RLDDKQATLVRTYVAESVQEIALGGDDRYVAVAAWDKVLVWDANAPSPEPAFTAPLPGARSVAFDGSGAVVVASGRGRAAIGWDWRENTAVARIPAPAENSILRFNRDASSLMMFGDRATVSIVWNVAKVAADICTRLLNANPVAYREA